MNNRRILNFSGLIICLAGFIYTGLTRNTEAYQPELRSSSLAVEPLDDCYDKALSTWFTEFNKNQNKGMKMHKADKEADKIAISALSECRGN